MSESESEEYPSLIQNRGNQTYNENDDILEELKKNSPKVIKYQLTSVKKFTHKPKRNSSQNEMLKTQTTKIDSISTFKREGFTPIFQSPEVGQTATHSNIFNSFCFTSEPRGGIVTFPNHHGASYSITFTEEQVDKVIYIQRQWRKIAYNKSFNELNYPGGIVYLPKDKSKFRSYSEDYNVCFDSKENMDPIKIRKLEPTYITKDSTTNYDEHAEKFVSSQFKLKSAPKILKAKNNKMKSDISNSWLDEIIPDDNVQLLIEKKKRILSIEQLNPIRIIAKNQMTYSIGCNTVNWEDLNKSKNEIKLMIKNQQKAYDISSFEFNIDSTLIPWKNKMSIAINNNSNDSSFQFLSKQLKWNDSCVVNYNLNNYNFNPMTKTISICNEGSVKLKSLKGFQNNKLKYDNGNSNSNESYDKNLALKGLLSILIKGKELSKKRSIWYDNAFELTSHSRKWGPKQEITYQKSLIINKAYDRPKIWNKINKPFTYNLSLISTKKNWKEISNKIQNDKITYEPLYQRHIWNTMNKKKNYCNFTIEKIDKPSNVFFSISSQNSIDYEINIGHSEKDIIHTLSKRDIMYLWNKLNKIEYFTLKNEHIGTSNKPQTSISTSLDIVFVSCDESKSSITSKLRKAESIRKISTPYTFREEQIMNSDEDDDDIDKIIAICKGDQFTINKKKKVSLYSKQVMCIENIELPEYMPEAKKLKSQKPKVTQANWNETNIIDDEGLIDIFVPGDSIMITDSCMSISNNNNGFKEYELEAQTHMNIVLTSKHKAFCLEKNGIQNSRYSVLRKEKKRAELFQSNIVFSIKQCRNYLMTENNRKILPQQSASFHYDKQIYKKNSLLKYSIVNINEFTISGLVKESLPAEEEKNFTIRSICQSEVGVTDSIEELIRQKWNKKNEFINTKLEIISSMKKHNTNTVGYSMYNNILFSYNSNQNVNQNRPNWDSIIFPVQTQFYKVISQEKKWRNVIKIIPQNIQVVIYSQYDYHQQYKQQIIIQSYSLRNPLNISNEYFELLTPRISKEEASPKSQTNEMRIDSQSSSHFNIKINSNNNNQYQPYSKPQKQAYQKESDVVFNSNASTNEIFINSITQYKSNGKKTVKAMKKPHLPSDISNGNSLTQIKP